MTRAAKKEAGTGSFVDGMTAAQVRERADLNHTELLGRIGEAPSRPASARGCRQAFRVVSMKHELLSGETESWKLSYLLDTILTRDTWMHRVDVAHATGREFVQTVEHDGRIVADAVAE